MPSLKRTSWKEIRNILYDLEIPYEENKSEGVISFSNGSKMYFGALDELSKVRSINADVIYIEQAEELNSPEFYIELMLRLGRGEASTVWGIRMRSRQSISHGMAKTSAAKHNR